MWPKKQGGVSITKKLRGQLITSRKQGEREREWERGSGQHLPLIFAAATTASTSTSTMSAVGGNDAICVLRHKRPRAEDEP